MRFACFELLYFGLLRTTIKFMSCETWSEQQWLQFLILYTWMFLKDRRLSTCKSTQLTLFLIKDSMSVLERRTQIHEEISPQGVVSQTCRHVSVQTGGESKVGDRNSRLILLSTNSPTTFSELYRPRIQRAGPEGSNPGLARCLKPIRQRWQHIFDTLVSQSLPGIRCGADAIWFLTVNTCSVCNWRVSTQTHFWDSIRLEPTLQMCCDLLHRFPWHCLCSIKWRHQMSFQACFCWQRPFIGPKLWRFLLD